MLSISISVVLFGEIMKVSSVSLNNGARAQPEHGRISNCNTSEEGTSKISKLSCSCHGNYARKGKATCAGFNRYFIHTGNVT